MSGATIVLVGKAKNVKEIKTSANGTSYLSWSCAVPVKDRDGNTEFNWYNCTIFGAQAESLDGKVVDGTRFVGIGSLKVGLYEKEDGTCGISAQVLLNSFQFAGDRPEEGEGQPQKKSGTFAKKTPQKKAPAEEASEDELGY